MSDKKVKPKFVPRPPEAPEVIEARWKKKKERLEHLSNDIRRLRLNISKDLNSDNEKVRLTAIVLSVMDKTAERVGNDASAKEGHYGVTGLRKKHVKVDGNKVTLCYTGKSGVEHEKSFSDEKISKNLKWAIDNSPTLFVFCTSDKFRIKNDRINRYLKDFGITAKDLRGFRANFWITEKLNKLTPEETEPKRKKQYMAVLKDVAAKIGHGRATLNKHYAIPELQINWVDKGKVVDIKDFGYMKEGGEVEEGSQGADKKKEDKIILPSKEEVLVIDGLEIPKDIDALYKEYYALEKENDIYDQELKKLTGSGGLISDEVRKSKEYIEAKRKFDASFKKIKEFNQSEKSKKKREFAKKIGMVKQQKIRKHYAGYQMKAGGEIKFHAPNGKATKLTPEQYKITRSKNFIDWFGDFINHPELSSKIVDENGDPLIVYHNTDKDFDIFKTNAELGAHFGTKSQAKGFGRRLIPVFLNIRNPIRLIDTGEFRGSTLANALVHLGIVEGKYSHKIGDMESEDKWDKAISDVQSKSIKHGYDGAIYLNRREGVNVDEMEDDPDQSDLDFLKMHKHANDSYIAFRSEQIKLADGTNTKFDSKNPDIRYEEGGIVETSFASYYAKFGGVFGSYF